MGVESKLRSRPGRVTATPRSYDNGDKRMYVKDACPQGCDEYIWHIALYYRDTSSSFGTEDSRLPILYTEIYERVLTDPLLSAILDRSYSDSRAHVRDTAGIGDTSLVTVLEDMIDYYFNSYYSYKQPSINDFCSSTVFEECKAKVLQKYQNNFMKTHGIKVTQVLPHAKPTKRSPAQDEVARIKFRHPGDEENSWSRARSFVTSYKEG